MISFSALQDRLETIEQDLAHRQNDLEVAAEEKYRLAREYELRHARAFLAASGGTATEKKARALEALAAADDGLYAKHMEAEGRYEGLKAAVRVLEQRSVIGMSLLRSHTREGFNGR